MNSSAERLRLIPCNILIYNNLIRRLMVFKYLGRVHLVAIKRHPPPSSLSTS